MDSCLEADHVPQLRPGVELVGEYQGSGLAETTYLVKKSGGQLMRAPDAVAAPQR